MTQVTNWSDEMYLYICTYAYMDTFIPRGRGGYRSGSDCHRTQPQINMIGGWVRWQSEPKLRTVPSILSLVGFVLASASAVFAVSTIVVAQFHHFPYYDPPLLRIFRWGTFLSLGGIVFGVSGAWRRSSLRWHAPVSATGMLASWFLTASME